MVDDEKTLYPDKVSRIERIEELKVLLEGLESRKSILQNEIDEFTLEQDILHRIDLLEQLINGEVKINFKQ